MDASKALVNYFYGATHGRVVTNGRKGANGIWLKGAGVPGIKAVCLVALGR